MINKILKEIASLYKAVRLLSILFFSFLSISCIEGISVPQPEFERLFGKWKWIESSGGFAGQILSPSTEHYEKYIEYLRKGIHKVYKNDKKESQMKFKFKEGKSIFSHKPGYLIEYADGRMQSFKFGGKDTLYLYEECMDCYSHVYIKQK